MTSEKQSNQYQGHVSGTCSFREKQEMYNSCSNCDKVQGECTCEHPEYVEYVDDEDLKNKKEEKSAAKKLVEFLEHNIAKTVISKSDSSKVFVLIPINGHVESFDLTSSKIKHWLKSNYYTANKEIHSDEVYKNAIDLIRARAIISEFSSRETINTRIAMIQDEIYYDLCSPNWQTVIISKKGVEILHLGTKTPIFSRSVKQAEQARPQLYSKKDTISEFISLLRIPEKYRLIFPVHLISLFIEGFPMPIMAFVGEQGSLKSTTSSVVKRIVDPSGTSIEDNTNKIPKNSDDLNILLYNKYCSVFDNLSHLTRDMADELCRAITGQTYQKRTLYTNSDETILTFKRKMVLNGISPNIEYPDLMERTIFYHSEPITEDKRITEEEFNMKFQELLPDLLGQIFKILSKALPYYPEIKKEIRNHLPRMADFTIWGECISRALGNESGVFLHDYKKVQSDTMNDVSDSHAIIGYVSEKMNGQQELESSVSEFYNGLKDWAVRNNYDTYSRFSNFPKAPNKIVSHITRIKPLIRNIGYDLLNYSYTKSDGRFTKNSKILKIIKLSSPPSPTSLIGNQEQNQLHVGESPGESTTLISPLESSKEPDFTPEKPRGESGESSEPKKDNVQAFTKSYFSCYSCNERGSGPFLIDTRLQNGIVILDQCKKNNHSIRYLTAEQYQNELGWMKLKDPTGH